MIEFILELLWMLIELAFTGRAARTQSRALIWLSRLSLGAFIVAGTALAAAFLAATWAGMIFLFILAFTAAITSFALALCVGLANLVGPK